jgi:hypothetical protein
MQLMQYRETIAFYYDKISNTWIQVVVQCKVIGVQRFVRTVTLNWSKMLSENGAVSEI